ncbi:agmatine deiminase family protein [Anaerosporobacter sp.]|uniref:agmatine deiminase family protein n=1 Tax=Anaerosporobacter sp. TaxID=1872529 RepID=UPI00286FABC8|nr:agmatine deiminase family protein [Anaerosporobacter sp.]
MISPKSDGFITRGEHEKHFGTIIMFPERKDIWRDSAVHAQNLIIDLANTIVNYEEVFFCVKPHLCALVCNRLDSRVRIVEIEYDDIWARDISPNFVVNKSEIRAVCWNFNSWGGLTEGAYYPWDRDAMFAKTLSDYLGIKKYIVNDVVLEGGAVIADGSGTLYTTKNVLLNKNRNPEMSPWQIEDYLKRYFCAERIVWLEDGLALDETNGHVDNVCSIVRPGELCMAWTDDENNPQYHLSRQVLSNLKASGTVQTLHKIPIPSPQFITHGEALGLVQESFSTNRIEGFQLVPSYINYYLINAGLIFPTFQCEEDEIALSIIKKIYPNREIIPFSAREPLIGGGGFHCILHEIPSVL